jgi:dolichol-phosphate mannosyltransferase
VKILVAISCYNEGEKLRGVLRKFPPSRVYDVLIVDDGSTDDSAAIMREFPFPVLHHKVNSGVGESIRTAIGYAKEHRYDILVPMAGNGKMDPDHIPRMVEPILDRGFDYVQGSRYLEGGTSENLPFKRAMMIKAFTFCVNRFLPFKGTDITCGFRAYRLDVLDRANINIHQDWLGRYEMEYYIHYRVIKAGLKVCEVPVAMNYPPERKNYSKIKAGSGWWSMIRPWIFLILRLKK